MCRRPCWTRKSRRGLLEETDYLHEAANLDYLREGLSDQFYVSIPRVHRELTTDRAC